MKGNSTEGGPGWILGEISAWKGWSGTGTGRRHPWDCSQKRVDARRQGLGLGSVIPESFSNLSDPSMILWAPTAQPLLPPAPPSVGDTGDRATTHSPTGAVPRVEPPCPRGLPEPALHVAPRNVGRPSGKALDGSCGWNPVDVPPVEGGGTTTNTAAAPAGLSQDPGSSTGSLPLPEGSIPPEGSGDGGSGRCWPLPEAGAGVNDAGDGTREREGNSNGSAKSNQDWCVQGAPLGPRR